MQLELLGSFIGGIGLFLLGMKLMTKGLMLAAGKSLKRILEQATRSPLRGLASGTGVTALVQSSSAVTVAIIGFVNAGLMSLSQAIPVIFGSNIGTTFTGWLVATLGFKVDIGVFALPLVGIGMGLRMIRGETAQGRIGEAIAGFGLFFVGVDVLKENFSVLGEQIDLGQFGDGMLAVFMHFLIGTLLTFLMQSSSASMALTLAAVSGGVISLDMACAMVIGANVGTTTTAILAALGGNVVTRRVAGGHVLFNLITGAAGLALLPVVIWLVHRFGVDRDPALLLALFHTAFNLFGVLLLWSSIGRLQRLLERVFKAPAQPALAMYLDKTALRMPALGMASLARELVRCDRECRALAGAQISGEFGNPALQPQARQQLSLLQAINDYAAALQHEGLNQNAQRAMPYALSATGYQQQLAELVLDFQPVNLVIADPDLQHWIDKFREAVVRMLDLADGSSAQYRSGDMKRSRKNLQRAYKQIKRDLLDAAAQRRTELAPVLDFIDCLRSMTRMTELAEKGARNLYRLLECIGDELPPAAEASADSDQQQAPGAGNALPDAGPAG